VVVLCVWVGVAIVIISVGFFDLYLSQSASRKAGGVSAVAREVGLNGHPRDLESDQMGSTGPHVSTN
jgi:hypothetical protein